MLDFIFAVDSPIDWHHENIQMNRAHYSSLAYLGASAVVTNAECIGAGVHFNTSVPWQDQTIKYGVVGADVLLRDLRTWDTLYIAGRLHKPVLHLRRDAELSAAAEANLAAALAAGLLLLPSRFSTEELFCAVCGLSYLGDVRMGLAEDKNKVQRIVAGSAPGLHALYRAHLEQGQEAAAARLQRAPGGTWVQDTTVESRQRLVASLPPGVLERLAAALELPLGGGGGGSCSGNRAVAEAVVLSGQHKQLLQAAIGGIVRGSSRRQAVAGFLMAGGARSAAYVWKKVVKAWQS
ncbi:hypothetical protein WJX81_008323 [Elliptochloris bilobata]|uniref:Phosphatidate cytidylyltransferase, mitochondrial n=1 Tax=Elliptochloris bilobata TaxID=381761 RepID=A0AAW1S7W7_9CHLO